MSIQNDIIKLAVEITSASNQSKVSEELAEITKATADLKRENKQLADAMNSLDMQGKKNSEQYKNLNAQLQANKKQIAENENQAKKYSASLDKTYMSADQLKKHINELTKSLNSINKAAHPEEWRRLNNELKESEKLFEKTRAGAKETSTALQTFRGIIGGFSLTSVAGKVLDGAKKMLGDFVSATGTMGNWWNEITAGMKAGYEAFLTSIASGDFSNFFENIDKATALGREYQKVLNDLENRRMSYTIAEAEATVEMEKQEKIWRDVSKPLAEREAALKKYNKLVEELGVKRKSMIDQELNDDKGGFTQKMEHLTKLSKAEHDRFIRMYDDDKELRKQAEKYIQDLKQAANAVEVTYWGTHSVIKNVSKEAIKAVQDATSEDVKFYAKILQGIGRAKKEELDKYVDLQKQKIMVDAEVLRDTQKSTQRLNQIKREAKEQEQAEVLRIKKEAQAKLNHDYAAQKLKAAEERETGALDAEQYAQRLLDIEVSYLKKRIDAEKEGSAERIALEQRLAEVNIQQLVKREQENAKILAERQQHFAALQKITDDYAKSQADKDVAEVLAIQQKYDKAFDAEKKAFEKKLITEEEYLLRKGELESMKEGEIAAKRAEQQRKAEEKEKQEAEKFAKAKADALKKYELMSLDELHKEELAQLQELCDKKLLTDIPYITTAMLLLVYGIEINSCYSNYFEARGIKATVNIFKFFSRKIDIIEVEEKEEGKDVPA